ncbi:hypothetical protein [Tuwongella immobilis]|uniref:DUF304 domain-containing protein n=1 Tax=Tuwongella immobilis TaxID=692036 RepID=A0A6C2YHY0_9BACT|nr:hypothetical protein [Tuwongella immobilis]VIP00871.1 Uncharacterized protein OS=Rivularia sp. PCC 7116 GN=Riv7116_5227 PE=4 SV=1 [Tuwongella immobilis]VTR97160.1 Uncharacterized protein OS=Rivularia sp. PCC 7116 GN=Riv7116_5227 PE=4 SV=1 [Tuwongella immobilis]
MDDLLDGDDRLPSELDERVQAELQSGERLLWVGQPDPMRMAKQALPAVLFGIPWTAFAIFWVAGAATMMGGFGGEDRPQIPGGFGGLFSCFPLFGLPFILIGLAMLTSPYWLYRQAKQTCYALTDRRAILWQSGFWGSVNVRSYRPDALGKMTRTDYADGTGDLIFEELLTLNSHRSSRATMNTTMTRHGFIAIRKVREVEMLLRRVLLPDENEGTIEKA